MANSPNIREVFADGTSTSVTQPASTPGDTFPVGTVLQFGGAAAPTGWQLCDGSALSRAGQPNLFAVIATTFGVGDGSTTFNVPDLRDKVPVGVSGTKALGSTGGEATHALTTAELAVHNHTASSGGPSTANTGTESAVHTHGYNVPGANVAVQSGGGATVAGPRSGATTGSETANHSHSMQSHTHAITVNNAGSGTAHNNMQPYLAVNHIIKL